MLVRRHGWTPYSNGMGDYRCRCGSGALSHCLKRWPRGVEVAPLARLREWWWRGLHR